MKGIKIWILLFLIPPSVGSPNLFLNLPTFGWVFHQTSLHHLFFDLRSVISARAWVIDRRSHLLWAVGVVSVFTFNLPIIAFGSRFWVIF